MRVAGQGMVCAIDHLAAGAGVEMLRRGGSAADAAIAAGAVLTVTCQDACGLGGDLWAVVHDPDADCPVALNASGRAGAGADPDRLRARGLSRMPDGEPAAVTVPGCVDGWLTLHGRFGRLAIADVLEPARRYAEEGFPASPELALAAATVAGIAGADDYAIAGGVRPRAIVRRPGVARVLAAVAESGREGYYGGEAGRGLLEIGAGEFEPADLERRQADWVDAVSVEAFGQRLWTAPPNSQGYLTLAGAWIADGLELPAPGDPAWAHLLIEAARQAAHDRLDVLHEHADGRSLLAPERLAPRRAAIDPAGASRLGVPSAAGDTVAICAVDSRRQGVSLMQSNAGGWGARLVLPGTGIFLHNRGRGFSLRAGDRAEYGPARRPPHTLSPTVVTDRGGRLRAVLGTMGGDGQPQILLQLLARLLVAGQDPGDVLRAGRFVLAPPLGEGPETVDDGFSTWRSGGEVTVQVEAHAPARWGDGLQALGHAVSAAGAYSSDFGQAQLIDVRDGALWGASDPRAGAGAAAGW
ncbi:MAG: gamma-glutamyltransferase [Solirubrobacteraceae bacterium]